MSSSPAVLAAVVSGVPGATLLVRHAGELLPLPARGSGDIRRFQEVVHPPEVSVWTAVMSTASLLLSSTVSTAAAGDQLGPGEAQAGRHLPQSVVPK